MNSFYDITLEKNISRSDVVSFRSSDQISKFSGSVVTSCVKTEESGLHGKNDKSE